MRSTYVPTGKALEYGELACNLYEGCSHGCTYCFNLSMQGKWSHVDFDKPRPREGIIDALRHSAKNRKKAGDRRPVFLCFTCDPYQPIDTDFQLTRMAIEILHIFDMPVRILTKGGLRALRDFDLLTGKDEFGVTLTFENQADSDKWEPHAASVKERLESLKIAHDYGIKTWVSMEPVIEPEQTLDLIRATYRYVDHYKVGRWNHDTRANEIDWPLFARSAVDLLNILGCDYYIKKDLKKYLEVKI